eukprot:847112-Prorocentrum_lima.AAC.1
MGGHPAAWDLATMRSRLALGQGGPQRHHGSSGAAGHLWHLIHGNSDMALDHQTAFATWDPFRR